MKLKSVVFFISLFATTFLSIQKSFSQNSSYSLSPKIDSALVRFSVFDAQNKPLQTKICFYGKNAKKTFCVEDQISKANNQNEILLPNNDTYLVYSSISVLAYQIPVSTQENQFYNLAFAFPTDKADQIQPTPEKALIRILPINNEKEPQKAKIILTSTTDNSVYTSIDATNTDSTNSEGAAVFLVPTGDIYSISINGNQNYDKIEVEEKYFSKVDRYIQYEGMKIGKLQPSLDSAVFSLAYLDLAEKPVPNEVFTITSKTTGKEYTTLPTDKNGKTQVKIPIGDTYSIGIKYFQDFMEQEVSSDEGIYVLPLEILYPSSEQIEARRKEIEQADKEREEEWKKLEAQMAALDKKNEELRQERIKKEQEAAQKAQKEYEIQVQKLEQARKLQDSLESIQIQKQIEEYQKKEEERKELAAKKEAEIKEAEAKELRDVLKRNQYSWGRDTVVTKILNGKKEWKKKLVVLDVTSSMLPYIEQVKYWYSLNYAQDSTMEFYLFNDGNGMSSARKEIGKTGGIYECKACTINELERLIETARKAGNGGDSQENDLEAILYALKYTDGYDELVLVADNMSYARDMIMIGKIGVPVRIILCGTSRFVNEQYLDIAYRTGGSVHTIEEEISDLSDMIEGKMITVSGYQYRFTKGRFFRMTKK